MPAAATLRERLLVAMPPPGEPMAVEEIARRAGIERKDAARALGKMRGAGLADAPGRGLYRLTRAGIEARAGDGASRPGPKGPLTGERKAGDTLRGRLWHALRISGKGTIPELLIAAGRGTERAAESNAARYLAALERAGIVTRLRRRARGSRPGSNGHVQWLLVPDRDTGIAAPVHCPSRRQVRDPNTGETFDV